MTELPFNAEKVTGHMRLLLDSLESTVPSAAVADGVAQLRIAVNVDLEGRNALSNQMNVLFSRFAE